MPDRRESLIEAAVTAIREGGYPALTQPKVAALAGMPQSHLTYYFPTRSDLVKAVAEHIVRAQLDRADAQAAGPLSQETAVQGVTALVTATDTTRLFMALVLAADAEPSARPALGELVAGMRQRVTYLLAALSGDAASPEQISEHAADGRCSTRPRSAPPSCRSPKAGRRTTRLRPRCSRVSWASSPRARIAERASVFS